MSVTTGGTFREMWILCVALTEHLDCLEGDDHKTAVRLLEYMRRNLWHIYPYQCEDNFDQRANGKESFSITPLPAEKIASNLAARESKG